MKRETVGKKNQPKPGHADIKFRSLSAEMAAQPAKRHHV